MEVIITILTTTLLVQAEVVLKAEAKNIKKIKENLNILNQKARIGKKDIEKNLNIICHPSMEHWFLLGLIWNIKQIKWIKKRQKNFINNIKKNGIRNKMKFFIWSTKMKCGSKKNMTP